jgi:hypothetical protein
MNFKFKDQPNGRCLECKWNLESNTDNFDCDIPPLFLTNQICLQKQQNSFLASLLNEIRK